MSMIANAPSVRQGKAAFKANLRKMLRARRARLLALSTLMFSSLWLCAPAQAAEFADVWSRQIAVNGDERSFIDLLPLKDGDAAVFNGERGIDFFTAHPLTREQANQRAVATSNIQPYQIELSDGRMVRRIGPPGCVTRPEVTLALEDARHKIQKQYALLWIPETPRRLTAAECTLAGAPPDTMQRVLILDPKLLALSDNTFLAADAQSGAVIRFDGDFGTHSQLLGDRLLLMPANEFKNLIRINENSSKPGRFDWLSFEAALEQWADAHRRQSTQP